MLWSPLITETLIYPSSQTKIYMFLKKNKQGLNFFFWYRLPNSILFTHQLPCFIFQLQQTKKRLSFKLVWKSPKKSGSLLVVVSGKLQHVQRIFQLLHVRNFPLVFAAHLVHLFNGGPYFVAALCGYLLVFVVQL